MDFFRYFFTDKIVKNLGYNRKILNAIVLISTIVEIIILMEKNKVYEKTENLIQTIVFIWLLPFAICVIRFFATNREMNVLMSPAFILIFIMNISLLEEICKISKANILTLINIIVLVIITWTYIISANATYELTILNYNKAISTVERIVANVEQMEEYSSGMPIIFCGIIENDNLTEVENMRLNRLSTGGVSEYNVLWEDFGDEQNGYFNLLVDFLGKDLGYVSNEKYMEIIQSDEFKEMDVYPNGNSIKIIDNCVVVKMQETPYELKQIETTEN
jgi:cytochrome c biogenesis factor